MAETFDPIEYLDYLRRRWKFVTGASLLAVALAALAGSALPRRYTATASLVIEPPGASDPRSATAISAIYLESLKSYEEFALSDSLFAKTAEKFHLLPASGGQSLESLKNRVLRVTKLKDTKMLSISVTLADAKQASAVARYLAAGAVALNRDVARDNENDVMSDLRRQVGEAGAALEKARGEEAAAMAVGTESIMESEVQILTDLKARSSERLMEDNATVAQLAAREQALAQAAAVNREELESARRELGPARARVAALQQDRAALDRETAAKSAALAELRVRQRRAADNRRTAEAAFEVMSRRANELAATNGMRTEQLRIVDPGIVPQRPSWPNLPLLVAGAFVTSLVLSLVYLTFSFGISRHRARAVRIGLRVASGGGR